MVLYDIVHSAYPVIMRRKSGAAINAGDAVYMSGDETVTKTENASCSGNAFAGVAMDTVTAADKWLGVATAPTEVYVNASGAIAVGKYVIPDAEGKVAVAADALISPVVIGYSVKAAASDIVLMKLIDSPCINIST